MCNTLKSITFVLGLFLPLFASYNNTYAQDDAEVAAPVASDNEEALDSTPEVEVFLTSHFKSHLPTGWFVQPNDWGALVTLTPYSEAGERAIDIFLEPIYVAADEQRAFADLYASSLQPAGGGIIAPLEFAEIADYKSATIRLRKGAEDNSLQEHWLLFHEQGIYVVVLTSDTKSGDADRLSALTIVANIQPLSDQEKEQGSGLVAESPDKNKARRETIQKLLAPHWLGTSQGDSLVFFAPYKSQFDNDTLTTLTLTRNNTPLAPGERVSFVTTFTSEYAVLNGRALNVQDRWSTLEDGSEICRLVMTLPPIANEKQAANDPAMEGSEGEPNESEAPIEQPEEQPDQSRSLLPHWETTIRFREGSAIEIVSLMTVADRIELVRADYEALVEHVVTSQR